MHIQWEQKIATGEMDGIQRNDAHLNPIQKKMTGNMTTEWDLMMQNHLIIYDPDR